METCPTCGALEQLAKVRPLPLLLTKKQAAEQLGISRDILLRLLNRGEICVVMIEEMERIPYVDLERFVERRMEFRSPLPVVPLPPIPQPGAKGSKTKGDTPARYRLGSTSERWLPGGADTPPAGEKKTSRT